HWDTHTPRTVAAPPRRYWSHRQSYLPYLLVQAGVENAGFGAQMRLEHLHPVFFVKFLERIIGVQIFQIAKNARLRRTNLHTRRLQSAGDAMITKRAFLGRVGDRVQEPGAI